MCVFRLLCLFTASVCLAQEPVFQVVPPASVRLNPEKLQDIGTLMQDEVDAGRIVGCLGLVARGDDVAWVQTWGQRDRDKQLPMTTDTIFRIYSMSKPITSVAAMQLVEQGKMQLDDAVSDYLPELKDLQVVSNGDDQESVPADKPITVRHILSHTSGFTYGFFGNTPVDQAYRRAGLLMTDVTIADTVSKLSKLPLLHQPGTRWHYSVSTDVLGRLVEVVSGERFDKYLDKHIFRPLKMVDTSFMVPADKLNRFAQMYRGDGNGGLRPANPMASYRFLNADNKYFSGGGGLCSTTKDYLRFCQALLNGGELDGERILKAATIREMTSNQIPAGRRNFRFGLGFSINREGEYSWGGAAGTRFFINPRRKLIGIYMIQINPYGERRYGNQMKQLAYAADRSEGEFQAAPAAPMP